MITFCCPNPEGNISIGVVSERDHLYKLLNDCGFNFLNKTPGTDTIRAQLDPKNKGTCRIEALVAYLQI